MFRWIAILVLVMGGDVAWAQTGAIEGSVKLSIREMAGTRTQVRYAGQPDAAMMIPATPFPGVVFIEGKLRDQPPVVPSKHPVMATRNTWFDPDILPVLVGTTVDFPNLDGHYHDVYSYSRTKRFALGRYPTGESRPVTFDRPGVVKIYCKIHDSMQAFIVVCENPHFVVTGTDGKYRLEGVPPGHYTVACWRVQRKKLETEVDVEAGKTCTMDFK